MTAVRHAVTVELAVDIERDPEQGTASATVVLCGETLFRAWGFDSAAYPMTPERAVGEMARRLADLLENGATYDDLPEAGS